MFKKIIVSNVELKNITNISDLFNSEDSNNKEFNCKLIQDSLNRIVNNNQAKFKVYGFLDFKDIIGQELLVYCSVSKINSINDTLSSKSLSKVIKSIINEIKLNIKNKKDFKITDEENSDEFIKKYIWWNYIDDYILFIDEEIILKVYNSFKN